MGMFALLACVTVMAVGRHSLGEALQITESVFVPATKNCTKNLLELLLWQHGLHVANLLEAEKTSGTTLEAISNTLLEMKALMSPRQEPVDDRDKTCDLPFMRERSHCLLLAPHEKLTWAAARQYCIYQGSELVILKDANTYAEFLDFISRINMLNEVPNIWVGASDSEVEGVWRWINGDLMPSGPPFWGSRDGYVAEPSGGRAENCGGLYKADKYYLHDTQCRHQAAPFCEKK